VELEDHGDGGDDHKMIKCSTWKEQREKQNPMKIKETILLRVFVLVIETP